MRFNRQSAAPAIVISPDLQKMKKMKRCVLIKVSFNIMELPRVTARVSG
jgi:hypothetical protein